ncbi:acyl-CoA carboxylase epsilon subunit [Actinosynnema sp. NPDC047251]|uniref:acyl-CoA carboxylase epsilon subunit n=1 Tax=Saccharothrix espanaensis TaxID=103731 RepID=UPI000318A417|nr:acyl-CoA carboxylase epsilon subunit [Saccharothrix espanaensis]
MTPPEVVAVAGNPTPEELAVALVVVRALAGARTEGDPAAATARSRPRGLRDPLVRGPWRRGARL